MLFLLGFALNFDTSAIAVALVAHAVAAVVAAGAPPVPAA